MNFLVFDLCDNDYGYHIRSAVEYAKKQGFYNYAGEDCKWWKAYVIQFVMASLLMSRYRKDENIESTKKYLENGLKVYASIKWPTYDGINPVDHGGGSVVFDLHTENITQI
jgi:hypothetical protein